MDQEDIILIEKAKQEPAEYEALYKKYVQKIFNYFWYRVGHQVQVAEDLTQETFLRAFRSLPNFHLRSYSYYSYLLTIAHNVLVNYYRKPQPIPLESVGEVPQEIIQEINKKETAVSLWRAIQQLSQTEKDILLLRYQKDLSIKEIARIVGKSENAVKLVLSRVRKKLSKQPYLVDLAKFSERKKDYQKPDFLKSKK